MKLLIIMLTISLSFAENYIDLAPDKITKRDLEIIKNLDQDSYKIAERKIKLPNIEKIYNFIVKHKIIKDQLEKLTVDLKTDLGTRSRAYVSLNYKILDRKREREIKKKILEQNQSILQKIESYLNTIIEVNNLKEKLEFLRLRQIAVKAEYLTAVKYRDQRLDLLEEIQKTKIDLQKAKLKRESLKIYLLNLVDQNSRSELKGLL